MDTQEGTSQWQTGKGLTKHASAQKTGDGKLGTGLQGPTSVCALGCMLALYGTGQGPTLCDVRGWATQRGSALS